ncbi:hypothetical protein scyTo_0002642 [Scyliorhinus torazame]|uniref:Sodium channel regulatory subunit beta-3 n=1 Tax=Scyliorhinus torazame TaxID=75743 RepID=A0A401PKB6_SCYTO|nr:hypothetical protein [Scyliorhinus torazame]
MNSWNAVLYSVQLLVILFVHGCWFVCVEVPSDTEALHGTNMKLTCISCMRREEVNTDTMVEWTYISIDGKEISIYEYNGEPRELKGPYQGRILWNGSKDLQDVSITIVNVSLNDSGLYRCTIKRHFNYEMHRPSVTEVKEVQLTVHEDALEDFTSYISEIMMYLLLKKLYKKIQQTTWQYHLETKRITPQFLLKNRNSFTLDRLALQSPGRSATSIVID